MHSSLSLCVYVCVRVLCWCVERGINIGLFISPKGTELRKKGHKASAVVFYDAYVSEMSQPAEGCVAHRNVLPGKHT